MSMSLLEIIEAAGYNPRNPDDAIRLTAILNEDDIEHLNAIIENTIELDYNKKRTKELQEQLKDMASSDDPDSEYQSLVSDINRYTELADEYRANQEKLL